MKKMKCFILLVLPFLAITTKAQTESKTQSVSETKKAVQLPFEKVYLHLDRPYYIAGDDIWFKAYLVNARTNKLYNTSNNLYIELISQNSKILKRIAIRMDKGLGNGDFHLGDSIPSGKYQIRAYTNWMRNFGETFFFKKEVLIESVIGIKPQTVSNSADQEKVDVQFFPEGGSLIENTYSLVGFKALNSTGYGCHVKGKIISSTGDTVNSFESTHLGMGNFNFIPKKGFTYTAIGKTDNGQTFKVAMPQANKTGYSIKVLEIENFVRVSIKTNQETLNRFPMQELIVVGLSQDNLCVTAKTKIKALVNSVNIPKKEFPVGITRITLMDTMGKPYCERLCYFTQKQKYHISLVTDKKSYEPRQMVNIQISVRDTANNPVSANLSLSAVDGNQVKDSENPSDINSYFLLESELRGHIEQPSHYFDTTKTDRYKALDNLLLTQGWRDFVWKYLSDTSINIDYFMEKGISISGRLRRLLVNKPIANANISMALFGNGNHSFNISKTDSTGKYYFDGLNFSEQQTLIISATNKNNRSQGWISLDSLFGVPPSVKYHWIYKPEAIAKTEADFKQEADKKYNILKKYHLTDTIALSEVIIKARKPECSKDDGHFRMYGEPDYSLTVTDQMSGYNDIFQLIQGRVAGLLISGFYPNISFSMRGSHGEPLFLLDGMPVELDVIATVPVADVDKIEVLKNGANSAIFGMQGGNGVISVFTKQGFTGLSKPIFHSINQKVNGYYQARTFYEPKYNVSLPKQQKPDLRTTIHWEPNIITTINGTATVSFFNADSNSNININIEGVSDSGVPIVGKANYEVKQTTY